MKVSGKKWIKGFNNILQRSFKKVRINNKGVKNEEVHTLMRAKTVILKKISELMSNIKLNPVNIENQSQILVCLQEKVDNLDIQIADICAEKNVKIIKDHYATVTDCSGAFNIPKMWGLKKKLNLQSSDMASAKLDKGGNLITTRNGILELYIDRLSHKKIRPEYEELKKMKENLFDLRYQISESEKQKTGM